MPSIDEIRKALSYDPMTGLLTWKETRNSRALAGKPAGNSTEHGYMHVKLNYVSMKAHRVAWAIVYGRWPQKHLDHINGNPADNRIENLRECDDLLNQQNQRQPQSKNTSGYLGVSFCKSNKKWKAQIRSEGKKIWLGYYLTPQEASIAYINAKRKLHPFCTI